VGEKVAVASQTAVAAGLAAAPVAGAVAAGKYLTGPSAMEKIEKAQEERKKRKEQGQP
jgi:ribulose kinase